MTDQYCNEQYTYCICVFGKICITTMSGSYSESNLGKGRSVPIPYGRNGMDQSMNKVKEGGC